VPVPTAKTAQSPPKPASAGWTVVDSVTGSGAPESPPSKQPSLERMVAVARLKRLVVVASVLAAIGGIGVAIGNSPEAMRQLGQALPFVASLFDRATGIATGEQKSPDVRYVGGVDPVSGQRQGAE
jgi:hypothetical protein